MEGKEAHGKPIHEVVTEFQTHLERGLTQKEAQERLRKFGATSSPRSPGRAFSRCCGTSSTTTS